MTFYILAVAEDVGRVVSKALPLYVHVCECEYEHVSVLIQSMNYLSQSINQSISQ